MLMKKVVSGAALACGLLSFAQASDARNVTLNPELPIFQEKDGLIVIQVESMPPSSGWVLETGDSGYTGNGYYEWKGPNHFGNPGNGTITYQINVTNPGVYNFRIRNQHDHPDHTEENDVWVRHNQEEWFKIYSSQSGQYKWTWQSRNEELGHVDASFNLNAGPNTIELSGRSNGMKLDQFQMYLSTVPNAPSTSFPESQTGSGGSGGGGGGGGGGTDPIITGESVVFDFEGSTEGWMYAPLQAFTSPATTFEGSALTLITSDNTQTFGSYSSPKVLVPDVDAEPIGGYFYEVQAQIRSSSDDPSKNPTTRIRVTSSDYTESLSHDIVSSGNGTYTPDPSGKIYRSFFSQGSPEKEFSLHFDVMNFDKTNRRFHFIHLDEIALINRTGTQFIGWDEIARYDFSGNRTFGFTPVNVEAIADANLWSSNAGLMLSGESNGPGGNLVFGFWSAETPFIMEKNTIYEVRYSVSTSASASTVNRVPTYRMRISDSGSESFLTTSFESATDSPPIPTDGNTIIYRSWFYANEVLGGRTMNLAFDYLYVPGLGNDPSISVNLKDLTILEHSVSLED